MRPLHSGFTGRVRYLTEWEIQQYSLPIDDAASAKESSLLVDKYSTITAVKTAFLSEFVHMSFHLQNWFSGMTVAKAPETTSQSFNIGRTDSSIEGTVGKTTYQFM
jgi:hypothetical protein